MSIILFLGFNFVNFLSDVRNSIYVGEDKVAFFKEWKLWFYVVIGLLFTLQQIWLRWPKPAVLGDVEDLKHMVERLLENVLTGYYNCLSKVNEGTSEVPSVRINVMMPTWKKFRVGRFLKMFYSYGGPAGIRYSNEEQDLVWKRKQGTCGDAWAKKRVTFYDSENPSLKAPEKRLTQKQRNIVGYIKSVISLPIWSKEKDKLVGMLNLDSTWNIDRTSFDHEEIVRYLDANTGVFSHILFKDGVSMN